MNKLSSLVIAKVVTFSRNVLIRLFHRVFAAAKQMVSIARPLCMKAVNLWNFFWQLKTSWLPALPQDLLKCCFLYLNFCVLLLYVSAYAVFKLPVNIITGLEPGRILTMCLLEIVFKINILVNRTILLSPPDFTPSQLLAVSFGTYFGHCWPYALAYALLLLASGLFIGKIIALALRFRKQASLFDRVLSNVILIVTSALLIAFLMFWFIPFLNQIVTDGFSYTVLIRLWHVLHWLVKLGKGW